MSRRRDFAGPSKPTQSDRVVAGITGDEVKPGGRSARSSSTLSATNMSLSATGPAGRNRFRVRRPYCLRLFMVLRAGEFWRGCAGAGWPSVPNKSNRAGQSAALSQFWDLRLICSNDNDYAHAIERSVASGDKITGVIADCYRPPLQTGPLLRDLLSRPNLSVLKEAS